MGAIDDELSAQVNALYESGDKDRQSLPSLVNQAFACHETDPERSLSLCTRGRDEALRLNEPWWVLYFESSRLEVMTAHLEDFGRALPLAMDLIVRFNTPPGSSHPSRNGVMVAVLETYQQIDAYGFQEELERGFESQEAITSRESGGARFVLNYRWRTFLCSTGRWEQAYDNALQTLALIDRSSSKLWFGSWALYQLCQICHMLGYTSELADHAAQMAELSARHGQLRRTEADGWIWQGAMLRLRGEDREARQAYRRGMRLISQLDQQHSICANSTAAYHLAGNDVQSALAVRNDELAEVTRKGMLHRICEVQLERCRLLKQLNELTPAELEAVRNCGRQLRKPQWFLKELAAFELA
ncbi:MAG: hypothetical protein JSS49_05980 [Planctomycetes bacterium]|nr:hypothetical protein [Planctomycetota bacterium]